MFSRRAFKAEKADAKKGWPAYTIAGSAISA